MDIFDYKCINKKNSNDFNTTKKYFKNLLIRSLITIVLCLILGIIIKSSDKNKEFLYKNIYGTNLSFTSVKKFYDKYLGGVLPIDDIINTTSPVFNENLVYSESSKYHDGVKLKVEENYLIPALESGIVVFDGEKENYGKTIIIQGMDGVDIWYSNIENDNVDLYDYVEAKTLLANTKDDVLYLVYSKNGEFLNYEEYLQ